MKIQGYNIVMIRGDTESIKVSCQDAQGVAVSLQDGDTLYFTVKTYVGAEEKEMQKVITDFPDGIAFINIAPDDTKLMRARDYYYDIQLTRADRTVKTIIPPSIFTVKGDVTYE